MSRRARIVRSVRTRQRPPRPYVEIARLTSAPSSEFPGQVILQLDHLLGRVWRHSHCSPARIVLTMRDASNIASEALGNGSLDPSFEVQGTWKPEHRVGSVRNLHDLGRPIPLWVTAYAESGVLIAEAAA